MAVLKVTEKEFESVIEKGSVLVDFYADWCGPCKMVAPIVEEIAAERTDLTVAKINVDEDTALAIKFGVVSIPTLIVFKDGKESSRIVGYRPKEGILAELDR